MESGLINPPALIRTGAAKGVTSLPHRESRGKIKDRHEALGTTQLHQELRSNGKALVEAEASL
jgi:hypothetical protein